MAKTFDYLQHFDRGVGPEVDAQPNVTLNTKLASFVCVLRHRLGENSRGAARWRWLDSPLSFDPLLPDALLPGDHLPKPGIVN